MMHNERFKNTNGRSGSDKRKKLDKQTKGTGSGIRRTNNKSLQKVEPLAGEGKSLQKE